MFVRVVAPKSELVKVTYPKSLTSKLFVNRGETGATGPAGPTGATGATGSAGIGYTGVTSASTITIGSGLKTFTLVSGYAGAFVTGMRIRAIHSDTPTYFLEGHANYVGGGTLIITVDKFAGSGSHNSWTFVVAGEVGQTGATGPAGPTGVVAATAPITYNSGTQTVGITQSGLTLTQSQVTNLTTDLAAKVSTTVAVDQTSMSSTVQDTHERLNSITSVGGTSQTVYWSFFTPLRDITVSQVTTASGGTAAAGVTGARMGLYSISGTTLTLLARTASDATLFTATSTLYTRSFDTTGGYPATYTLTAGTRYAFAIRVQATTMPTLAATSTNSAIAALTPRVTAAIGGLSDLPTTQTVVVNGSITSNAFFGRFS